MNVQEIQAALPHRYPFLMLDRVIELVPGERVHAIKNVSVNEPQFQGHFPGTPIMPGVLLVEAIAQACGILASQALTPREGQIFYLTGLDGFRFRRPVVPGDVVHVHVEKTAARQGIWKFSCRAEVEGRRVVDGSLTAALASA